MLRILRSGALKYLCFFTCSIYSKGITLVWQPLELLVVAQNLHTGPNYSSDGDSNHDNITVEEAIETIGNIYLFFWFAFFYCRYSSSKNSAFFASIRTWPFQNSSCESVDCSLSDP
jgi:hypothetical protein